MNPPDFAYRRELPADDPAIDARGKEEARQLAVRYFDLAYTYAARLEQPALILITDARGVVEYVNTSFTRVTLGMPTISRSSPDCRSFRWRSEGRTVPSVSIVGRSIRAGPRPRPGSS